MNQNTEKRISAKKLSELLVAWGFQYALISYLFFYLVETISSGFITRSYNLNYHVGFVVIISIIYLLVFSKEKDEDEETSEKIKIRDYIFIIVLSFIAAIVIYYRLKDIGQVSYLISVFSGLLLILTSILLLRKEKKNE